jgi:hypothetical protein
LLSGLREQCASAFQLAVDRGEGVAEFDPAAAAVEVAALVDGLILQLLSDPDGLPAETATEVLDTCLRRYVAIQQHT